ncbi:MAG: hypothetical protein A4E73_01600 [Syntrophaceae bacterium PtaU1.Bin231]|nr:MAG: hypothetical protein A4E73_01600 [Syntrophaceae bacterium PtaU1.Bin231]
MLLISAESRNRTGAGVTPVRGETIDSSSFSLNRPGSAGVNSSLRDRNQPGWVKSPVPITWIPLTRAQPARPLRVPSGLVARE